METSTETIRLTQYSHGAGCGCKIAPDVLSRILNGDVATFHSKELLVGYAGRDDAAVYDLGDGSALISTTDFFSPIVDDAFDLGRIAACNALSDVYAMGGSPLLAVAILGWPVEKLPAELAAKVLDGARVICAQAGIPLAGGHSIDAPEPFFGLAVTGKCAIKHLKRNNTANADDVVYLTKPLGTGVLSTAMKRGLLDGQDIRSFTEAMAELNSVGAKLGKCTAVTAMTDVTGFGLFGHLIEMCGDHLELELPWEHVPTMPGATELVANGCYADGALRNWKGMHDRVSGASTIERMMLGSDPQTNGGLLVAVRKDEVESVEALMLEESRKKSGSSPMFQLLGRLRDRKNGIVIKVH